MAEIKNLVFKGGGVLGIAYAGAINILEQKNLLAGIERIAGTSAGASTAALVALGYSAAEIKNIVSATNFKSFEDDENILRIATKYGLYEGDALLQWIQNFITGKGFDASATFSDFRQKGCKDLSVFSLNLNLQNVVKFSFETTPDVVVAEAVRASMSIPMFFEAWKFPGNNPDGDIYVDGGVVYNYPITTFDDGGLPNEETLGFYLTHITPSVVANNLDYDHVIDYVKITFESILNAQDINVMKDPETIARTVMVDDLGLSATDFDITPAQENDLFQSGVKCTIDFLNKKPQ